LKKSRRIKLRGSSSSDNEKEEKSTSIYMYKYAENIISNYIVKNLHKIKAKVYK